MTNLVVTQLTATTANITTAYVGTETATQLTATTANITTAYVGTETATQLTATTANITTGYVTTEVVNQLTATTANITTAYVGTAYVQYLEAQNVSATCWSASGTNNPSNKECGDVTVKRLILGTDTLLTAVGADTAYSQNSVLHTAQAASTTVAAFSLGNTIAPDSAPSNMGYRTMNILTSHGSAFNINAGPFFAMSNSVIFNGTASQTLSSVTANVLYRAKATLNTASSITIAFLVGHNSEVAFTGSQTNTVTNWRGFQSVTPTIPAGNVLTTHTGFEAQPATATNAYGFSSGFQTGSTLAAAFLANTNTASCGGGYGLGTAVDLCMWRASAGVLVVAPAATGNNVLIAAAASGTNAYIAASVNNLKLGTPLGTTLATNAVNGFPLMPACAGTPSGAPTGASALSAAFVADGTNNLFYFYTNGAWRQPPGTTYTGTANQITLTGTVFSLATTLIAPGTIQATTSTTTPAMIASGAAPTQSGGFSAGACSGGVTAPTLTFTGIYPYFQFILVTGDGVCSAGTLAATIATGFSCGAKQQVCVGSASGTGLISATTAGISLAKNSASNFDVRATAALVISTTYAMNVHCGCG